MASQDQENFTKPIKCGHCGNVTPMRSVAHYFKPLAEHPGDDAGHGYNILLCPACESLCFAEYFWYDGMETDADVSFRLLYPREEGMPLGLPIEIQRTFTAALKVKSIDTNAFGVLLGRVLEKVCEDRKAHGNSLDEKLSDLAKKNEIPTNLVEVAHSLRKLRNIGAHASLGELTGKEVPILESLSRAILEYVYTAPHLATLAKERLKQLKNE